MKNSKKRSLHVGGLAALLGTAACTILDTAVIREPKWYCEAFRPITWGAADSAETVTQIFMHNAAWDSLCKEARTG